MRYLLFVILLSGSLHLFSQPGSDIRYDWAIDSISLEQALYDLTDHTGVSISFINSILPDIPYLTHTFQQKTIEEILEVLLAGANLRIEWVGRQILILRNPNTSLNKFSISGYVRDSHTGELLIGANVYSLRFAKGTTTNSYGYFSLTLTEGPVDLSFSYLGYKTRTLPLDLRSNQVFNISLNASLTLGEVLVIAPSIRPGALNSSPGKQNFRSEDIESLPSLGGEPDLLRISYLLPGVQTGSDGFGGLSVRGGGIDQNLVLLDGAPVYNATHFVGIFSIFNSSAIRTSQLFKGVFPARYGGRVSSVLDVRTKEGNNKDWIAEGDIGLASGKISVEGPLAQGKSSIFVGARRSFLDLYSRPYTRRYFEDMDAEGEVAYYFFDINAKVNYKLGHKDHLYGSFYTGGDKYSSDQERASEEGDSTVLNRGEQAVEWGNATGALRWNHLFNDKLFSNTTLTYSRFFYGSRDQYTRETTFGDQPMSRELLYFRYHSNNRDLGISTDFDYRPDPDQTIRFGASAGLHHFQPGRISYDENTQTDSLSEESIDILLDRTAQQVGEYDLYFEDEFQVKSEFGGNLGLRATALHVDGRLLFYLQPRFQLLLRPRSHLLFSIGVGRSVQTLHLLSNSGIGMPRDLWVSSTSRIRPVDCWQVSGGASWTKWKGLELSFEAFYKYMKNLIAFQEGLITAIDATNWQNKVAVGAGWAYGAEWMLKARGKNISGWLAYTLAFSKRQFEEINLGESFPFSFDRRHSLHLTGTWAISPRWQASIVWTYGSGAATTLPRSSYQFNQFNLLYSDVPPQFPFILDLANYGRKNDLRLPDYHRLDLDLKYIWKKSRAEHQLSLGVYNAYNRLNPIYYILAERTEDGKNVKKYLEVALLPAVPTLKYRLTWAMQRGRQLPN
ncbi:MAG: carboxypeptidase-like regulatory domain-containing protein [Saprospirales bacterium]|nr:carboxypeptidase-like regulatory domain-containing protein [Saprospirales bacterium]